MIVNSNICLTVQPESALRFSQRVSRDAIVRPNIGVAEPLYYKCHFDLVIRSFFTNFVFRPATMIIKIISTYNTEWYI